MIKLTKINVNKNSTVQHAKTVEEYKVDQERGTYGQFFEGKSPPIDYWIVGEPIGKLEEGKCFMIDRYCRNGVKIKGAMYTSPVESIEHQDSVTYFTTQNSVYKMEEVVYHDGEFHNTHVE
jgi:hypothetical protein